MKFITCMKRRNGD